MLSKQLESTFIQAVRLPQSAEQLKSLAKLKNQVDLSSIHQACLRCEKAGHVLIVDDHLNWRIVQVKCDDYRSLPPNIIGFGIGLDYQPSTVYFCDEEAGAGGSESVNDDVDPGHRQRGFVAAEREHAQPTRIDRER